jgi:hypothetical protein
MINKEFELEMKKEDYSLFKEICDNRIIPIHDRINELIHKLEGDNLTAKQHDCFLIEAKFLEKLQIRLQSLCFLINSGLSKQLKEDDFEKHLNSALWKYHAWSSNKIQFSHYGYTVSAGDM